MRLILRFVSCCHHPYQPGGGWNDIILGEALSIFQENLPYFQELLLFNGPKLGEARASVLHRFRPP